MMYSKFYFDQKRRNVLKCIKKCIKKLINYKYKKRK